MSNKVKELLNKEVDIGAFLDKYVSIFFALLFPLLGILFYFVYKKKDSELSHKFIDGVIIHVFILFLIIMLRFIFKIISISI